MIDDALIERFREYVKCRYVPHDCVAAFSPSESRFEAFEEIDYYQYKRLELEPEHKAFSVCKIPSIHEMSDKMADYIKRNKERGSFAHTLENMRESKGIAPAALYKKANVDKRLYSKIMGPERRHPSKNTALSFGMALKLERAELDALLQSAGYSLVPTELLDVGIMFCLENQVYDINDVNALLFSSGAEPLTRY